MTQERGAKILRKNPQYLGKNPRAYCIRFRKSDMHSASGRKSGRDTETITESLKYPVIISNNQIVCWNLIMKIAISCLDLKRFHQLLKMDPVLHTHYSVLYFLFY